MKIKYIVLALLFSIPLFSQSFKYAWLTDTHIGSPKASEDLLNCVNDINNNKEIEFVIISGDVAEKGRDGELEESFDIFSKLDKTYYIIPGNHDTKWSESGGLKFRQLFKEDKFHFESNGIVFLGINSGILWRGGGGHITSEDLVWLDSVISLIPEGKEIYFYLHHELSQDTDNWFKVSNIIRKRNIKAVFIGHGHANKLYNFNGFPGAMGRSSLTAKGKSWGYTLVSTLNDTIFLHEVNNAGIQKPWGVMPKTGMVTVPEIDSVQFKNYGANIISKFDLKTTISASLHTAGNNVYAATYSGMVYSWKATGEENWKYNTHNSIVSSPVEAGGLLCVGTLEGDLFTLRTEDGKADQVLGLGEPITSQLITTPFEFNQQKSFAVIAGTSTGKLYSYEIYSLNPIWTNTDATMMIETKPIFINDRIVYGSWDNYLYSVDSKTGLLNWRWTENKNFYYSPAACHPVTDGKNIYVATPDKFVSAVDLLLGKTVWRKNDFGAWESIGISSDKKQLLVKSVSNKFYTVSTDGKKSKVWDLGFGLDTMPSEPLESGGNILFGTKNGFVYLIDAAGNAKPLLYLGTSRVNSVRKVNADTFAVSNMDGTVVIFKL
ncbi:MAG: PQQ-binding-like beta-propeller repeat protein [Ignavibacteriaceae bacterium]